MYLVTTYVEYGDGHVGPDIAFEHKTKREAQQRADKLRGMVNVVKVTVETV